MSIRTNIIENLISEEVKRFSNINGYINSLSEQFLGLGGKSFQLEQDEAETDELNLAEPVEGDKPKDDEDLDLDLGGEEATIDIDDETEGDEESTENVEGLDVTELVTITKETGEKAESLGQNIEAQKGSIDSLMAKIDDLETKLNDMDNIVSSVEKLETKIEKYRIPTPQEKLNLRYLDSGPFTQKISDYWDDKQDEMAKQKDKHEYVLTQQDVDDYSDSEIKKSWVYDEDEEENI